MNVDTPGAVIGEVGTVAVGADRDARQSVEFGSPQPDPVVVAKPLTHDGPEPAHVRVSGVTETSAEVTVEEWPNQDGPHVTERTGYAVVRGGSHRVGTGSVEAGTVETDHTWAAVSFEGDFERTPVVFTQSQTRNGPHAVVTRNRGVGTDGFQTRLQEAESRGRHRVETVGYVAVEPGVAAGEGSRFEAGATGDAVDDDWHTVGFDADLDGPLLADLQTTNGGNTASLRRRRHGDGSVDVFVDEETSTDAETDHVPERVGYWVFGAAGPILGSGLP